MVGDEALQLEAVLARLNAMPFVNSVHFDEKFNKGRGRVIANISSAPTQRQLYVGINSKPEADPGHVPSAYLAAALTLEAKLLAVHQQ